MPTEDPINDTTPPPGKIIELPIAIRQPQKLGLWAWIPRLLVQGGDWVQAVADHLRAAAARQRRGRPSEHDYDAIITAIEACAARGVDNRLNLFVDRALLECKDRHIKAPGSTQLTKYCRPFWQAAQERRRN